MTETMLFNMAFEAPVSTDRMVVRFAAYLPAGRSAMAMPPMGIVVARRGAATAMRRDADAVAVFMFPRWLEARRLGESVVFEVGNGATKIVMPPDDVGPIALITDSVDDVLPHSGYPDDADLDAMHVMAMALERWAAREHAERAREES